MTTDVLKGFFGRYTKALLIVFAPPVGAGVLVGMGHILEGVLVGVVAALLLGIFIGATTKQDA
jgi:uncharacterized membrane protein (DUF4010 family)